MSASSPAVRPPEVRSRARVVLHLPNLDRDPSAPMAKDAAATRVASTESTANGAELASIEIAPPAALLTSAASVLRPADLPTHESQFSLPQPVTANRPVRMNSLSAIVAFLKRPPVVLAGIALLFLNLAAVIWFTRPQSETGDQAIVADQPPASATPDAVESLAPPAVESSEDRFLAEFDGKTPTPKIVSAPSKRPRVRPDVIVPPEEEPDFDPDRDDRNRRVAQDDEKADVSPSSTEERLARRVAEPDSAGKRPRGWIRGIEPVKDANSRGVRR